MKAKIVGYTFSFLALLGLFAGIAWLIHLRFATGQAYPARSTMRTDPLGAKALYEAYAELDGIEVSRNFVPIDQLQELPPEATLIMLGLSGSQMYQLDDVKLIRDFVYGGGKVVYAMNAGRVSYKYLEDEPLVEESDDSDEEDRVSFDEELGFTRRLYDEEGFWAGMALRYGEHEDGDATLSDSFEAPLPATLPWREGGILVEYDTDIWEPIYVKGSEVVAASRVYGEGSVVLMTDDYLFSNEALLKNRYPQLLAWITGGKKTIIFEETHLGVASRTGIATLIHRYQLRGFFVAFAGFMMLVVWRGAFPLLPAFSSRSKGSVVQVEHSTEAGLSDLLRRSTASVDLPRAGFDQWKASFIRHESDETYFAAELKEASQVLAEDEAKATRKRQPRVIHSKIKSIINRKKRRRK